MGSKTALIVEDSPAMRQLLTHALKRIPGMETAEACDGVDALNQLDQGLTPDIVITDINMPVMDGMALIKRLRDDERFREIPIVIITTEGGAGDRARAFALGVTAYITKPIQAPKVLVEIEAILGI
jgi:two-component system chemotaxis response regulator CheY